ncbi:MAG TPA: glycosyltransferase family 39 protein [Candidatus Binatia bacterium]
MNEERQTKTPLHFDICDWIFLGVLLLAFLIRLNYFLITRDQPLWWDEAAYMLKAKALVYGTPETGWRQTRPLLLPMLAAAFFKIGLGETAIRLLWIVLSTTGIFLLYRIGAAIIGKRVGLYAAILMSVFYVDLFYYTRLLVDTAQVFFILAAALSLVCYLYGGGSKYTAWAVAPLIVIGTAMRFTAVLFFAVVGLFLFGLQGTRILKKREWQVSAGLAFVTLLPLMLYYWIEDRNPLYPFFYERVLRVPGATGNSFGKVFSEYIQYFPNYTNIAVTVVFIAGMVVAAVYLLRCFATVRADRAGQAYALLLLWIAIPLLFFGFFVDHFEDRFLSMIFPAVFLLTGAAIDAGYNFLKRYSFSMAAAAVTLFLLYAAVSMALRSDAVIADNLNSFAAIQNAGLWIKAHSQPGDSVITSSVPQNTYYSERRSYAIPQQQEEFERRVAEHKPKYLVLSLWEQSPYWAYRWPAANPGKASAAAVFFFDEDRKRPAAIVYSLNPEN